MRETCTLRIDRAMSLERAALSAGLIISLIILTMFALSSELTQLLALPPTLFPQPGPRPIGAALFVAGLGLALWLFRYRSPLDMIVSTYFTFVKMFTRSPISRLGGRTEPLVMSGPQKYVRHPLYLAAITAFFGWAVLANSTSSFVAAAFMTLWFRFVQIPFEEKELRAIFGDQYLHYCNEVPMLIPFSNRRPR